MFVLRSTNPVITLGSGARQFAGLVLLLVLVASIAVLALSMPEVTAEIDDNNHYTRMVPAPEYPNVSPTDHSAWG